MGDLEGDERDLRIAVFRRDRCRDVLVGLELDDEVDLLTDQDLGVALRDFRVVRLSTQMSSTPCAAAARCRPTETSFENW